LNGSGRRHDATGSLHAGHDGGHGSLGTTTSREGVLLSTSSSLAPRAHHARKLSISSMTAMHAGHTQHAPSHTLQQAGSGGLDAMLAAAASAISSAGMTANGHAAGMRPTSTSGTGCAAYGNGSIGANGSPGHALHDSQHSASPCLPDSQGFGSMAERCIRLLIGSTGSKAPSHIAGSAGGQRTCSVVRVLIVAPCKVPAWLSHCLIFKPLAMITLCMVSA
jgi:hypothetical protein